MYLHSAVCLTIRWKGERGTLERVENVLSEFSAQFVLLKICSSRENDFRGYFSFFYIYLFRFISLSRHVSYFHVLSKSNKSRRIVDAIFPRRFQIQFQARACRFDS